MEGTRYVVIIGWLALALVLISGGARAQDVTSEDFALRILPPQFILPPDIEEPVTVDFTVNVTAKVAGVQGWSFGIQVQNSGLDTFYIENAAEHPDLASIAGDQLVDGSLSPGRPIFDAINFYEADDLATPRALSGVTNEFNEGFYEHDSLNGVPGQWAAVIQGAIFDFYQTVSLPATESFGTMALKVKVNGVSPNSGRLVFSDQIGTPKVDVVIVYNGESFQPDEAKDDTELRIPPAIQAPATISFLSDASSYIRGEINGDGVVDIADPILLLTYLMGGGETPGCEKSGDTNDDGVLDIGDAVYLLSYLFGSVDALDDPHGACGSDTTPDDLTCEVVEACR